MRWDKIAEEVSSLLPGDVCDVGPAAQDTLHGSMWGLNHRYSSVRDCLRNDWDAMISYSLRRIRALMQCDNITYRKRQAIQCQIGFGTYGWKYAPALIEEAVALGVSLIDTAEGYGFGRVETALGGILPGLNPVPVMTKVSRNHMSPSALYSSALRSNEKLGVIPHMQLHYPHSGQSDAALGAVLVRLRKEGRIKSIGLGNCSVDMIESMQRFLSDFSGDVIQSVQIGYSLIDRRIESCLLPYCQDRGILVIAYSPLGQKYKTLASPLLEDVARRYGCSAPQIALAWILQKGGVVPIPRTNNINHLRMNIEANDIILEQEDVEELEGFYPIKKELT